MNSTGILIFIFHVGRSCSWDISSFIITISLIDIVYLSRMSNVKNITIVGAGLCGTLLAIRLAQHGYTVDVYEKRSDMRMQNFEGGRSINLALSNRGLKALALVGLEDKIEEACIPMEGRKLHLESGEEVFSPYSGRKGEYINSVSRSGLNVLLLNEADKLDNVQLHFNHSCLDIDLEATIGHFKNKEGELVEVESDLIFGTDGAGSIVRKTMASKAAKIRFSYSQDFLTTGYKELRIPPTETGGFRIDKNALHIWPRGSYMMIALPNLDGSFTVTCFFPYKGDYGFDNLKEAAQVESFFNSHFPDAVAHMPTLVDDYFSNPVGLLGTNKCYPWQCNGKVMLLGDAAHAIVPFYGQGMNASFEDVTVLDEMFIANNKSWDGLFEKYEVERKKDADAIADLALDNFHEMQTHTADPSFQRKRKIETRIEQAYPEYYSKYSMVTFKEDMRYSEAIEKGRKQDAYLMTLCADPLVEKMSLEAILSRLQEL